jgi:hypothetical protein
MTNPVCYYPERGDSLAATIDANRSHTAESCATAGCSLGQPYLCCVTPPPMVRVRLRFHVVPGGERRFD